MGRCVLMGPELVSTWTSPDGDVLSIYLQGRTIIARPQDNPPVGSILEGGYVAFMNWSVEGVIQGINVSQLDGRYRGTDLALAMVGAALRIDPDLKSGDDLTCAGAHLARRVNERYGTSFTDVPRPDRIQECRRPDGECMFH